MQTSAYGYSHDKAFAGMKYDIRPDNVGSYAQQSATPLGLGFAVTYGTDPDTQCKLVTSASEKFLGISLATHTLVATNIQGDVAYAQFDTVNVLREGAAWVEVTEAVVAGDPVYVNIANGKFCKTATNNLLVPNAKFLTSQTTAGQLAVVEIL